MIGPARIAAYEIGLAISGGRADLPSAVAHSRPALRDDRDRALAIDIATGVQRWRATLDHVIAHAARRPVDRLDPEIVEILRLSAYQLLHLSRVPAAAVVDDAVELAKRAKKASAKGFVNGVLRTISRRRDALPLPPRPSANAPHEELMAYLTIALSHPRWVAERWLRRLGFERTERWMRFNNTPGPLTLRANLLRMPPEELARQLATHAVEVERGAYAPNALIVRGGNPLRVRDDALEGSFVVQDEASQLVTLLAGSSPGPRVLDTCASPGGKATALAAAAPDAFVVACDVRERRMQLLRRTVAATGAANVRLVQADLLAPMPFRALFDCVIVDAPCSGLGTLRRDPDIRWRRQEAELATLAAAQLQMLRHAASLVRPGGRLVYATCSSEPEENDGVADAFLAGDEWFEAQDGHAAHPDLPPAVVDAAGRLRTEPDRHGLEVFFGAVFRRRPGGQM
jgi:16S rRNA (cytosine967-C5)-methyltransferase